MVVIVKCCVLVSLLFVQEKDLPGGVESSREKAALAKYGKRKLLPSEWNTLKTAFSYLKSDPKKAAELAEAQSQSSPPLPDGLQAQVLWIQGAGLSLAEKHPEALEVLSRAEDMARELNDPNLLRQILRYKAASAYECSQFVDGRAAASEALELKDWPEAKSAFVGALHLELANCEQALGNKEVAAANFREAIRVARSAGNSEAEIVALTSLGQLLLTTVGSDDAATCFHQVLQKHGNAAESLPLAAAHAGLAEIYTNAQALEKAAFHLEQARTYCDQPGSDSIRAAVEFTQGRFHLASNNIHSAGVHFRKALEMYERLGDPTGVISVSQQLRSLEPSGNIETVVRQLNQAENTGAVEQQLSLQYELASLYMMTRNWKQSSVHFEQAATLERQLGEANLQLSLSQQLSELNQEQLIWLRDDLESKLDQLRTQRTWNAGLVVCVALLLAALAVAAWLLKTRRRAMQALRHAHRELGEQKAMQLQMERQLAEQQKSKSLESMASGVAHDFNNLLTGIAGLAELAAESGSQDRKNQLLEQITTTSVQASGLTGQLLQFLGQPVGDDAQCDVRQVVASTFQLLESVCRPCTLQWRNDGDSSVARIGETALRQIIVNLVTNAAEASGNHNSIVIEIDHVDLTLDQLSRLGCDSSIDEGEFCRLDVIDSGHGMTEEARVRIFDPYFSTRGVGRGLGLSSVVGIVRSCGGFVRVESKLTEGSRFSVYLPSALPASGSADTVRISTEPTSTVKLPRESSPRVLVVDDERLILELQEVSLRAAGMEVVTAVSAEQAVEIVATDDRTFDCVLTDYSMPGRNGKWLAAELRSQYPNLPVILCSGYAEGSAEPDEVVARVLMKPYTQKELVAEIRECLEIHDAQTLRQTQIA